MSIELFLTLLDRNKREEGLDGGGGGGGGGLVFTIH